MVRYYVNPTTGQSRFVEDDVDKAANEIEKQLVGQPTVPVVVAEEEETAELDYAE